MKSTEIALKAYNEIENYIDVSIRLINNGSVSYTFCYAHITGMTHIIERLGFISINERDYIDTAVNFILPVNLKAERR